MAQYARVVKWIVFTFMSLLILTSVCFSATRKGVEEFPDVFVHENTSIGAGQAIGKLMVAGGDASVGGTVTDGIIVVDGNLIIKSGARITGRVVVLGGSAMIEQGASVEYKPWTIVPQGHPLVPVVVGGLFLIGAVSLIILPVLFWIIGHLFKRTKWYSPIKEKFLAIERRWPALYIVASLGISALMLTVFGILAWETLFHKEMVLFDDSFVWLIRYFANPTLDKIMIIITNIGFGTSYIVIVAITLLLLAYLKRWRELGALTICLAGGGLLSFLLKILFHRTRPDLFRVVQETGYSFPSGHALATMCFYGMVAFLIMRTIDSWRGRLTVMTLAVILSMLIGISRIYLGVHYPTDVIAGYAAGSMWLAFCISLLMWWERARV
ncbi:phosphatase PAP2 family protein [Pelosinus sp. UFO1]|uniref:phosphatase PAP2 family protein n=1 Tax=Pelosinus sp. UFO1 TaxID=484770 RepID=UPI0004D109C5|nr:phosphatase PAP2 family protein [Pelosinus sp. UFO1]AIF50333.1 phosphoesterase PA-phosphatase related protein [Pelosinus sp. UFO1]